MKTKEEKAAYQREWRSRNPGKAAGYHASNAEHSNQRRRERTARRRQTLNDLKAILGCSVCGESDPRCLHFHHREPSLKNFGIGNAVRSSTLTRLLQEAKKCDVLCANCHEKHHHEPY